MKDIQHKKGVIRIEKKEYKGHTFIDIRKYYQDSDGEWLPTKKGVTLPLIKAQEIVNAILEELNNETR